MKAVSFWAMRNPARARFYITIIKLLLAFMAVYTGLLFSKLNIAINPSVLYLSALLTFILILLHPRQTNRSRPFLYAYIKQKLCIAGIAMCAFVSIAVMTNNLQTQQVLQAWNVRASSTRVKPTAGEILESLKHRNKNSLTKQEKRILRKEFYKELKIYTIATAENDKEKKKHAGLIILTILGSVGMTFILAILACSLSCSGSDVAAILVGVVGLAALIWGTIATINSITGKTKKKKMGDSSQNKDDNNPLQ